MPQIIVAAHYYLFMKWFKNNYPRLYTRYGLLIKVPKEGVKIVAAMEAVNPSDRDSLQHIIDAYNVDAVAEKLHPEKK